MSQPAIVITGGEGFVGRWLVKEMRAAAPRFRVVVWDQRVQAEEGVIKQTVDITEPDSYRASLQRYQPAWIVHLAAVSSVQNSWQQPELAQRVNVVAVEQLLREVETVSPASCVLAISSADIYGLSPETERGAAVAELPLSQAHPINPYAKSKWEMERLIEKTFNDRVIRVRPFPHIGAGQAKGFVTADFASQIAAIEKGKQAPVIKVGNLEVARDFTDVRDVVRAYRLLMEKGRVGEVYHVASGVAVSIDTLLQQLLSLSRLAITVEVDPAKLRPLDVPVLVGDASKLRAATGWQPDIPLEQSLTDILTYWRSQ